MAGSISLMGFGIDSFIEVLSGSVLLWRMSVDADIEQRHRNEKRALRIVGLCFLALAIYIAYESANDLLRHRAPAQRSRYCPSLRLPSGHAAALPRQAQSRRASR